MTGTALGNMIALLYFLFFQICGVVFALAIFKNERPGVKLMAGSVFGSVLLQWLPVLPSFFLGFNVSSHATAAVLLGAAAAAVAKLHISVPGLSELKGSVKKLKFSPYILVTLPVFLTFVLLVIGSLTFRDGTFHSSQATYGDTTMHLGFITGIAEQGTFPPDYTILPGTKLSYPFLSDSISSSLYIFGSDLIFAYCLPMFFAGAQVMYGFWLLIKTWLSDNSKTALAFLMFFLCGGFGFAYFLSGTEEDPANFTRIFTAFYETPTNLVEENIRWVNMIVDILLPQRASLFGYAVLMFTLYLLYRAVWDKENRLFPIVGILAGALPMIHTHSFVALALVSGGWLFMYLAQKAEIGSVTKAIKWSFAAALAVMQLLQLSCVERESDLYLLILTLLAAVFAIALLVIICFYIRKNSPRELFSTWGVYLLITLCLALPQLFTWTFKQAGGENFIRGYFNWANETDNYLWFYVKNMGLSFLMFIPGIIYGNKKRISVVFPVLVIWVISELAVFQPNVYDNNKFLYVAYIFVCGMAADYMVELYRKIKKIPGSKLLAAAAIFLCTVSGVLTIGREFVADYELIGETQVYAAEFIKTYTEPEDTFLTDQRHNNAVAALSGRNIVCGSPSYLYFHGLNYTEAEADLRLMFESPKENRLLFEKYSVDYIMVSDYERSSYYVDEPTISTMFTCVFAEGDTAIYAVN